MSFKIGDIVYSFTEQDVEACKRLGLVFKEITPIEETVVIPVPIRHRVNDQAETVQIVQKQRYQLVSVEELFSTAEHRLAVAQGYLQATDWYVARYAETGVEIPEEVKVKRAEARSEISRLRGETV